MTREEREEALAIMNVIIHMIEKQYDNDRVEKAVDTAIASLKAEPCEDAVSLDAVINTIEWYRTNPQHFTEDNLIEDMKGLPPVTPKQRTGKWIAQDIHNCHTDFKCSECGYIHSFLHLYGKPTADYTYCPNCGAKMEGESE